MYFIHSLIAACIKHREIIIKGANVLLNNIPFLLVLLFLMCGIDMYIN